MEIRTPKGKLYGTLNPHNYVMTITDGKNSRQFPVPKEGCRLWYTAGNGLTEEIII
jgi:hypothetical protein